ncbi:sortilin 1b [Pholidichthys leucotaenia]
MGPLSALLLLAVCTLVAAGLASQPLSQPPSPSHFVKRSNAEGRAAKIAKRSPAARLAPSPDRRIKRRDAVEERAADACKALRGSDSKLKNNTHPYIFNDLSGSVSLAWVGDGTGVILALTTFQVPFFMMIFGQSKLYRSENYGKSFHDVTDSINNTFIKSEYGFAIGPENSGKVILTADVSGHDAFRIFVSKDFGKSFIPQDIPFLPKMQIMYNPEDSNGLAVLSKPEELWVSEDFGSNWKKFQDRVCLMKWGNKNTIFFTAPSSLNGSCYEGMLHLKRSADYGKTIKTIATKVYSFALGGSFLFASVMSGKGNLRMIYVSKNQGDTWNKAQLPAVNHEQFYSILAANDEMVFMHVDEPGDTGFGTIYVSDDRGIVYSKSLERHLYTPEGNTDFTTVTSLRGVFITNVLAEDNSVQSVVSFDQGGEWIPLRKPASSQYGATAKDSKKYSLHIHASYSISKGKANILPLTEPNAVGLILAHGSVDAALSEEKPDVYISDDGGYTWIKALTGPHHYAILDSGGVLVAVENTYEPINKLKFSTDEGQCWSEYEFIKQPLYFTGLASEPGARSMNVSIWGYTDDYLNQNWVSVTIDFKELLTRDCDDSDYVEWLAHSNGISGSDGCLLGYKEKFLRLKKDAVCYNGRDFEVTKQPTPCPCTLDDFMCDFGYSRKENSSECVEQPDLVGTELEFCVQGEEEKLETSGYRKIPGDKCEGGINPTRKEIDLRQKCVSDMGSEFKTDNRGPKTVAIVIVVIIILLLSTGAGVVFVKKYICGGRFLVHRYSVLQQHAEETVADGIDEPLETDHTHNGKITFHDDSDEDLLE